MKEEGVLFTAGLTEAAVARDHLTVTCVTKRFLTDRMKKNVFCHLSVSPIHIDSN